MKNGWKTSALFLAGLLAVLGLFVWFSVGVIAQQFNPIVNYDFEMGDLTGWIDEGAFPADVFTGSCCNGQFSLNVLVEDLTRNYGDDTVVTQNFVETSAESLVFYVNGKVDNLNVLENLAVLVQDQSNQWVMVKEYCSPNRSPDCGPNGQGYISWTKEVIDLGSFGVTSVKGVRVSSYIEVPDEGTRDMVLDNFCLGDANGVCLGEGNLCPTEDDRILRISDFGNAHGEVWDGAEGYGIEVCYSQIFGNSYQGGSPHACTASNLILGLSDVTNAHAEIPNAVNPAYDTEVCYGDLVCQGIDYNFNCEDIFDNENVREVLSLSSESNAHLEREDENAFGQGYKLCCGIGGLGNGISNVEWQNFLGNGFGEINESYINRTVYLFVQTTFDEGTEVDFNIWEKDLLEDDFIRTITENVDNLGRARVSWFISDEDAGIASQGEVLNPKLEFYFNVTEEITGLNADSRDFPQGLDGYLHVQPIEGPDFPPKATISAPKHRGIYFTGTNIEFNQTSFDPEGTILTYNWTIEKGGSVEFSSTERSFEHSFPDEGERVVTLRVTDVGGKWDEDEVAILVSSGNPGLLGYINKPWHLQVVSNQNNLFRVDYSAEDSYVIKVSPGAGSCPVVECFAGDCPSETENTPLGCVEEKINVSGTPKPWSDIDFDWTFRDSISQYVIGGLGEVQGFILFDRLSNSLHDKEAELSVSYENQSHGIPLISENVNREFTLGQCLNNGNTYVFLDGNGEIQETRSTREIGVCEGQDRIVETSDDCCPSGQYCMGSSGSSFCAVSQIDACADYTERNICNDDPENVAERDPAGGELTCQNPNQQRKGIECYWEDNGNANPDDDLCGIRLICEDRNGNNGNECIDYICQYTYSRGECVNGYIEIEYTQRTPNCELNYCDQGEEECPFTDLCDKPNVRVPCGRLNFELSFFDYWQFIASLVVIFAVYFVMNRRKKIKK